MLEILFTTLMKKDLKRINKRGYKISKLEKVIDIIASGKSLPSKYKDHALVGDYSGHRECHIEPDWLLIYKIEDNILILTLTRTGTHSDLF